MVDKGQVFQSKAVKEKFHSYPKGIRPKMLFLRMFDYFLLREMTDVYEMLRLYEGLSDFL